MTKSTISPTFSAATFPPMPGWVGSTPSQTMEDTAFRSGAALAHLTLIAGQADLPHGLWRERLALLAAENGVRLSGRREGVVALRDALHLLRPGDHPGPAGVILRQWFRSVARPISVAQLGRAIEGLSAERIAVCLDAAGGNPVDRAAAVLEAILTDTPHAETAAMILADAVLSKSIGQDHLIPVLALAIKPRDLRMRGSDLRFACHMAAIAGAKQVIPLTVDVSRAALRLHLVAPKLRAKAAHRAIELFLSLDAVAPSSIAAFMSDRAARRLCDRLVVLGAVRELTGRETFRLYGL